MAAYDLEEQEQLDELKTWWKMHGTLVTALVVAAALGVAGWQGWNWWQRKQSAEASALYYVVQQSAATMDAKRAREATAEITDKYSGTAYAGLAALLSAKVQADVGDIKTARVQLAWAQDNAKDPALRDLARLRLAALMLDEKAYDEALKTLAAEPASPFVPRFAELKGDVLAAQGKGGEAKAAYENAVAKLDAQQKADGGQHGQYRDMLQAKLESVGGGR